MKKVNITSEDEFTPLSSEDDAFAFDISKDYDVPFEGLSRLIRDFRSNILNDIPNFELVEYLLKKNFKKYEQKLFYAETISITIKTNKGQITIKPSDPYFKYFNPPIKRIKVSIEKLLNTERTIGKSLFREQLYLSIYYYLVEQNSLKKFRIYGIIGKFMVHFKIFIGKPLMTKKEWEGSNNEAPSYEAYLNNIVKSRLKKIFKNLK